MEVVHATRSDMDVVGELERDMVETTQPRPRQCTIFNRLMMMCKST
jgi:hypothetical protein